MTTLKLSVAVANIKGNPLMSQHDVDHDVRLVAGLGADVTTFAEIKRARYKRAVKEGFDHVYNLRTEIPTATDLPVIRSWVTKLYDGVARVTPSRYNAGVRLDTSVPVLMIAKHPVSGSYRTGKAAASTVGLAIRKRLFALDTRRTRNRVARANRKGVTVIVAGDLNTLSAPLYSRHQRVALRMGLLWVIVCPARGVKVAVGTPKIINTREHGGPLFTDHPAGKVGITLTGWPVFGTVPKDLQKRE